MPLVNEHFNGGVVTIRDSTLLTPGELQQADECVYRLNDPSIQRAPGRTVVNATPLGSPSPIKGLSVLPFPSDTDLLVAYVGTNLLYTKFNALSGLVFSNLVSGISDAGSETMDTVPFGSAHYIAFSGDAQRKVAYRHPQQIVDANCTIAGDGITVTTTTAKGLKNTQIGQFVTGTGVPANTFVATKISDTSITLSNASTPGAVTLTFTATAFPYSQLTGLQPVNTFLATQVTRVAGTWPNGPAFGTGFYWFLYTEMLITSSVDDTPNGFIEGSFVSDARLVPMPPLPVQVVNITDVTTQAVQITRGNIVNSAANGLNAATHWQVYMAKGTDGVTPPSPALFVRLGSPIPIGVSSFTFSNTTTPPQGAYPTAFQALNARPLPNNPTGIFVPYDGVIATFVAIDHAITVKTFGFSATGAYSGATVSGILVQVYMANNGSVAVTLRTSSKVSTAYYTTPNGRYVANLGGDQDTWGESWVPSDFVDGTFLVDVVPTGQGVIPAVEGIHVTVYYNGPTFTFSSIPFRVVTYRDQIGTTVSDPAKLPPPQATTIESFRGSVVSNDVNYPTTIRWSLPNDGDSWPKPYVLSFTERQSGAVTCIRKVGQALIVGLVGSIERVNYLPSEVDTDFREGLAHEPLSMDHGIVGPLATALFSVPRGGTFLAYVSNLGIHKTDGVVVDYLNTDLDWANTVDLANLSKCVLLNYAKENWLVMFYAPKGGTGVNSKILIFSYSRDRIKMLGTNYFNLAGQHPAIGPITVSGRSACPAIQNGTIVYMSGHQFDGNIYLEDQGTVIPTGYTVDGSTQVLGSPTIVTRRFYPAGVDREARGERVYVQLSAFGTQQTINTDIVNGNTTLTAHTPGQYATVKPGMMVIHPSIPGDTVVLSVSGGNTLVISQAPVLDAPAATLTDNVVFDSGTLAVTIRGQNIGETPQDTDTTYVSSFVGGLVVAHDDNARQALQIVIQKVRFPDASVADLGVGMRLHYFAYDLADAGKEQNRAGV